MIVGEMMRIRDAIKCLEDKTGFARDKCIDILLKDNKIRSGGNRTNGLLANGAGGASLLINTYLASEKGVSVKELIEKVSQCSKIKKPHQKIAAHLRNCQEYALPHRISACDLKKVLENLYLLSKDGKTIPVVCVNGRPEERKITYSIVYTWLENDILTSPLLTAIASYNTRTPVPDWVRVFMPHAV